MRRASRWRRSAGGGDARRGRRPARPRALGRAAAGADGARERRDASPTRNRLSEVMLDEATIPRGVADRDHERAVAIFDLDRGERFGVARPRRRPLQPHASRRRSRKLTFDVRTSAGEHRRRFVVSMTPFRPLLKDYFLVCETYYSAIRTAEPAPDRGDRPRAHHAAQRGRRADGPAPGRQGGDRRRRRRAGCSRWSPRCIGNDVTAGARPGQRPRRVHPRQHASPRSAARA